MSAHSLGDLERVSRLAARSFAGILLALIAASPQSRAAIPFDAAAAFGARPSVDDLKLSPDGQSVAYVVPTAGQGSAVYALRLVQGAKPRPVIAANGDPDRIGTCNWVSNERLVCVVYGVVSSATWEMLPFNRLIAVNADGSNMRLLSTRQNEYSRGLQLGGGRIVDWLSGNGDVLMSRVYIPDDHLGTRLTSDKLGLGVDRVDTRDLSIANVEEPTGAAVEYLSDGRGTVRIMGLQSHFNEGGQQRGVLDFEYRREGFAGLARARRIRLCETRRLRARGGRCGPGRRLWVR